MSCLSAFLDWCFQDNYKEMNAFLNTVFENKLKNTSNSRSVRDLETLNSLDLDYIAKDYNKRSENSVGELKGDVKTSYVSKNFSVKYKGWFIVKPLVKSNYVNYKLFYALYFPNAKEINEVRECILNKKDPCFDCNYLSITDMVEGKEHILFIGGLDEPEPCCEKSISKEHCWEWDVYREDSKEILFAECKNCGIKKSLIIGDERNYQWNVNHGWRYYFDDDEQQ